MVGGYGQGNPKAYIFLERSLSHINLCWDNSRINNNKTPSPVWWRISWEQSQKRSAKEWRRKVLGMLLLGQLKGPSLRIWANPRSADPFSLRLAPAPLKAGDYHFLASYAWSLSIAKYSGVCPLPPPRVKRLFLLGQKSLVMGLPIPLLLLRT